MGFSEDFEEVAGAVLSTVSDKAKEIGTAGKLNIEKKKAMSELGKMYVALGKKYYEDNKDSGSEEIHAITKKIEEIKKLNDKIIKVKGGKTCPNCETVVPKESDFCHKCGEKLF